MAPVATKSGRRSYRKHGAKSSRTNRSTPAASNETAHSMRLRPTHRDRRTRHGPAGKTVAHDARPLDWPRPGVVLRPPPVNPRPQRDQLDSPLVREHGLRLSACAICFDHWLPLTARSMPSAASPSPLIPRPWILSSAHSTAFRTSRRHVPVERLRSIRVPPERSIAISNHPSAPAHSPKTQPYAFRCAQNRASRATPFWIISSLVA